MLAAERRWYGTWDEENTAVMADAYADVATAYRDVLQSFFAQRAL